MQNVCNQNMDSLGGIVAWVSCFLVKYIIPLLFAMATVAFIYGVMKYFLNTENETERKKGKDFILGGIIALFVMISVWGLVGILTGTFNFDNVSPVYPQLQQPGQ